MSIRNLLKKKTFTDPKLLKVFFPLIFFLILLCCCLMLKYIKILVQILPPQYTFHIPSLKKNWFVTTLPIYQKEKPGISINTLNSVLSWSTFTASRRFGYDATSFASLHVCDWQLFDILLLTSSPLKLCQVGRGSNRHFQLSSKMFDWVQAQAIKDIHRVHKPLLNCPLFSPIRDSECSGQGFH